MAIKERKTRRESAAVSSSSGSGKHHEGKNNNGNNSSGNPMWMDWIEKSVDLLCEDSCSNASKGVIREALRMPQAPPQPDLHAVDFAALHDEFLESLLFEQAQNHNKLQASAIALNDDSSAALSLIPDEASQSTFSCSTNNSVSLLDEEPTLSRKRRRPIRLHRRRTPPSHRRRTRVAPLLEDRSESNLSLQDQQQLGSSSSYSSSVSFMDLSKNDYEHPSHYLHPQCRMQKDKGRGEAVGACICAKGRDDCLFKLRAKMQLLTEHAVGADPSRGKATMKRRKAIVAAHYDNFVETRSLIELRMGFLSLQYGVLLRWDTGRTGKVTLVVLRKMCHDSFYHSIKNKQQNQSHHSRRLVTGSDPGHVVGANNAIFSRPDGMEVALLEPPFRVPRPDEFAPSILRVSVLEVLGVNRNSNWTMQLSYDGLPSESIPLTYNTDKSCWLPKSKRPLKKVIPDQEAIATVDIKLYELRSRRRRRLSHRLVHTVRVPLAEYLQPQPSSHTPVPTRVRIPFQHGDNEAASVHVELLFQSDYACWLVQELEARRREEKKTDFFSSFLMEEERDSPWEWMICCVC